MSISKKMTAVWLALMTALNGWGMEKACYQVIPMPHSIVEQKGEPFVLDDNAVIVYMSDRHTPPEVGEAMQRNAVFLRKYIEKLTGIGTDIIYNKVKDRPTIQLVIDRRITAQEGYRLTVSAKTITIAGLTPRGVFYGIQTLRKSLPLQTEGAVPADRGKKTVSLPAVMITDQPRFGYRGMMLDCARHFFTVNEVKEYIDMLALHNMNHFHWHLTDDQGWRIEIKKYPRLTDFGSMRTGTVIGHNSDIDDNTPYGGFYTQEQIKDVIAYAADRYITIIPEIDMPGHTLAALACYPQLGCTGGPYEVGHKWGVGWDVLCVGNPESLEFAKNVLGEVIGLFPSEYIHIGGDETPTKRWDNCPKCKALGGGSVQSYFTREIEKFLSQKGRRAIGWDEIQEHGAGRQTAIMSWRGSTPGFTAAEAGHDVVMAPYTHCYFDYYQTKDTRHEPSVAGSGLIDVEKVYSLDPAPDSITAAARQHVIGVQANLWTEHVPTFGVAQYQVLPRMSALAEVQWSAPETKDFERFRQRAGRFTGIYDRYGWKYARHLWPERMTDDRWHF